MRRAMFFLAVFFAMIGLSSVYAQWTPSGGSKPEDVINKLSQDNFNNIRMITTSLMNYGGGEAEFDKLVQTYSEASALYFSKEYEQSAKTFEENEKQIKEVTMNLAEQYKKETIELQKDLIKNDVKDKIKKKLMGKTLNPSIDKLLQEAADAMGKANELLARSKYVDAIKYYRQSRAKYMDYLNYRAEELSTEELKKCKEDSLKEIPNDKEANIKCQNEIVKARKDEIYDKYGKVIADNKNKIFVAKEKTN